MHEGVKFDLTVTAVTWGLHGRVVLLLVWSQYKKEYGMTVPSVNVNLLHRVISKFTYFSNTLSKFEGLINIDVGETRFLNHFKHKY